MLSVSYCDRSHAEDELPDPGDDVAHLLTTVPYGPLTVHNHHVSPSHGPLHNLGPGLDLECAVWIVTINPEEVSTESEELFAGQR